MRYEDITEQYAGFDPLAKNITTTDLFLIGTFKPDATFTIQRNAGKKIELLAEFNGLFTYTFKELKVGDVIKFEHDFEDPEVDKVFWVETIRE